MLWLVSIHTLMVSSEQQVNKRLVEREDELLLKQLQDYNKYGDLSWLHDQIPNVYTIACEEDVTMDKEFVTDIYNKTLYNCKIETMLAEINRLSGVNKMSRLKCPPNISYPMLWSKVIISDKKGNIVASSNRIRIDNNSDIVIEEITNIDGTGTKNFHVNNVTNMVICKESTG